MKYGVVIEVTSNDSRPDEIGYVCAGSVGDRTLSSGRKSMFPLDQATVYPSMEAAAEALKSLTRRWKIPGDQWVKDPRLVWVRKTDWEPVYA